MAAHVVNCHAAIVTLTAIQVYDKVHGDAGSPPDQSKPEPMAGKRPPPKKGGLRKGGQAPAAKAAKANAATGGERRTTRSTR